MFLPVIERVKIPTITILYQLLVVATIVISICTISIATGNNGGSNSSVRVVPLLLLGP